ncbi:hypothetical protein Ssi03_75550 [Sphaerisporangium siamense]|nr:hypothetical protein Ssi03_75550 [Sphaerisporangium siamense]
MGPADDGTGDRTSDRISDGADAGIGRAPGDTATIGGDAASGGATGSDPVLQSAGLDHLAAYDDANADRTRSPHRPSNCSSYRPSQLLLLPTKRRNHKPHRDHHRHDQSPYQHPKPNLPPPQAPRPQLTTHLITTGT